MENSRVSCAVPKPSMSNNGVKRKSGAAHEISNEPRFPRDLATNVCFEFGKRRNLA